MDGRTDAHIGMLAVLRAARYATTGDARFPSPCPGAHLRSPSHRYPQHSAQRSEASLCAGMRGWAAPSLPRPGSPPLQPRSRPPPDPDLPPGGTCRPLEMGQNSTRCTNRRTLRMLRAPRARGPQSPGGMAAAPASLRGIGVGGGAEPRRPYAPPQRSRPGSAQIGSARLGSARRGAVHAAPPQLGGEEDWRGVRGGRGAEDARFGAARFGCAHPSAAPQPRVDPAAFRGCRSRPRAAAALRVTLLFLLRPLPSERESRAAAAAAALRVLHLGNLQRDRGCFDREHWAGPACALRGCGVRERSRVGRGRNKTGSAAGRLRTGLLLKELLTRYRWLLALPTCPFLTLHITHFHLPSAQDDP